MNCRCSTIAINSNNLLHMISNYESIDLSDASDIANIFKLDRCMHTTNGTVSEPSDIINGQSVIRVYSSINTQSFGLNSPLIDNLTHISMGLNNMITWDNLSIDVIDQPNIDSTDWVLTNANNNPIFLNSNIYVSLIISCYPKVKWRKDKYVATVPIIQYKS